MTSHQNDPFVDPFDDAAAEPLPADAQSSDAAEPGRGTAAASTPGVRADRTGAASDTGEVLGAGASSAGAPVKDPEDWVTGDEPMTDAQKGYLDTLARQAGETLPADLTKAQASEEIDRLQQATGRTQSQQN